MVSGSTSGRLGTPWGTISSCRSSTPYARVSIVAAACDITTVVVGQVHERREDLTLRRGRSTEHGVESRHHGPPERPHEVEDVRAVGAAPDPVLVLDRDHVDAGRVERGGGGRVILLDVATDALTDLGRIGRRAGGRMQRDDLVVPDGPGQGLGERRDAAAMRRVRRDECGGRNIRAPFQSRGNDVRLAPGSAAGSAWPAQVRRPCRSMGAPGLVRPRSPGLPEVPWGSASTSNATFSPPLRRSKSRRSLEAAAVEEVFLPVVGGDEAEATVGDDLLDGAVGHVIDPFVPEPGSRRTARSRRLGRPRGASPQRAATYQPYSESAPSTIRRGRPGPAARPRLWSSVHRRGKRPSARKAIARLVAPAATDPRIRSPVTRVRPTSASSG